MALIAGVDGCKDGWIAAIAPADDISSPRIGIFKSFLDLVDGPDAPDLIAVDMPIGLPDRIYGKGRGPEQAVRPLLGGRKTAVFSIPARVAVEAEPGPFRNEEDRLAAYQRTLVIGRRHSEPAKGFSIQAFCIFPKILEVDALLRQRKELRERVREVHPEFLFRLMKGEPLIAPKKIKSVIWPPGMIERQNLLLAEGISRTSIEARPPSGAGRDDLLDALAGLVAARHIHAGHGVPFPDPHDHDAFGIPIAIWGWRASSDAPSLGHMKPASVSTLPVTPTDIEAAAARIAGHVRVTPVMAVAGDAFGHDTPVSFKLEFLQHAGSFKPRGAFNTLLSRPVPTAGVAAASGGNHGAAVAYAAGRLGHKARIFVPEIASPAKIDAIRRFGAEVVVGGARYADALAACDAYVATSGALSIHAYDAEATIAGQGTLMREWRAQTPDLDTVLVAVGGGGLIAGVAAFAQGGLKVGRIKVVGVEPEGSCALHAALAAGAPVDVEVNSVAADSLGARNVGPRVHAIAAAHVDQVVLVPDAAILAAQATLWRDFRIAAEPGGATALAALLSGAYRPAKGERLGVLLCGANVDLAKLATGVDVRQ